MQYCKYPNEIYGRCDSLKKKPATTIAVRFLWQEYTEPYNWPAILDTGSPLTILPGRCSKGLPTPNEQLRVTLLACFNELSDEERTIQLRVSARSEKFSGVSSNPEWHAGFGAELTVPGFGVIEWQPVYFENIDHAIIGTPILFGRWGVCFSRKGYRPGFCCVRDLPDLLRRPSASQLAGY